MNELKPEDVMKALECCTNGTCSNCPTYCADEFGDIEKCTLRLAKNALTLVREKDEDIKRLKSVIYEKRKLLKRCGDLMASFRSQTITEFSDRLKEKMNNLSRMEYDGTPYFIVSKSFIDKAAEEMKGEQQ